MTSLERRKNMKRILGVALGVLLLAGTAYGQLAGTQRQVDNFWFSGDRAVKFGARPNASINYTGGNLVLDILYGGGKVSIPDGVDLGGSPLLLGESIIFEGATADANETTMSVVDPTADRAVSIPNDSGTILLSTAAQGAADSVKGVANGFEFEGSTADTNETTLSITDPTADRTIVLPDASGTPILSSSLPTEAGSISGAASSFVFEGATANDHETTLSLVDPTSDRTITMPDSSGYMILSTGAPEAIDGLFMSGQDLKYEGSTANDFESMIRFIADPAADAIASIPTASGYMVLSNGDLESADSFWGISNGIAFEGATANDFETSIVPTDPTSDRTITLQDASGTVAYLTDNVASATALAADPTDCGASTFATAIAASGNLTCAAVAGSDLALTTGIVFEGSTADDYETTLAVTDPTVSDKTVTLPNLTGTVLLDTQLSSAQVFVGSAGNLATPVTLSGDVTMDSTGAVTVTDDSGYVEVAISSANIAGMFAAPVEVIAAQAGKAIEIVSAVLIYDYDTDAYTGGGDIGLIYAGGTAVTGVVTAANSLGAAGDKIAYLAPVVPTNNQLLSGTAVQITNASGAFVDGGPAAGVARLQISYRTHTTGL
jgi:hypothetical protein